MRRQRPPSAALARAGGGGGSVRAVPPLGYCFILLANGIGICASGSACFFRPPAETGRVKHRNPPAATAQGGVTGVGVDQIDQRAYGLVDAALGTFVHKQPERMVAASARLDAVESPQSLGPDVAEGGEDGRGVVVGVLGLEMEVELCMLGEA